MRSIVSKIFKLFGQQVLDPARPQKVNSHASNIAEITNYSAQYNKYQLGNNWLFPSFTDKASEREFQAEFNASAVLIRRAGIALIIIIWVAFSWVDLRLAQPQRHDVLFFRLGITTPILIMLLALTFLRRTVSIHQTLLLLITCAVEGSLVYVVSQYNFQRIAGSFNFDFPLREQDAKFIFVLVWLVIIFIPMALARLLTRSWIISAMVFVLWAGFSVVLFNPSWIILSATTPFVFASFLVSWFGSLFIQHYARDNYRIQKLLTLTVTQSESLLLNIFPRPIVERLKKSTSSIADGFSEVTVLFANIADFTPLSQKLQPNVVLKMLNTFFSEFDHICKMHGVEKIKTIGDAYMAAAGVPQPRTDHCSAMVNCALDMVKAAENFTDPCGNRVKIRIGIHTGPVVAGVIGVHKFAYDLWGDTVNIASRMESSGAPGRIQVTAGVQKKLEGCYLLVPRGDIEVKGKGKMSTWWLTELA